MINDAQVMSKNAQLGSAEQDAMAQFLFAKKAYFNHLTPGDKDKVLAFLKAVMTEGNMEDVAVLGARDSQSVIDQPKNAV